MKKIYNKNNRVIDINNSRQSLVTLSTSENNPVLLIVHGGPGSPDRPLVCKYNGALAKYYTVVCWDQRCSGLSYTKKNKKERLSIDLMLRDIHSLVIYLTEYYNQNKIYIAGHSWGAYLGLRFAYEYPQYVKYYIGTGQGISSYVDEIYKYNFVKLQAEERGDQKTVRILEGFGTPIGMSYPNNSEKARKFIGSLVQKYGGYISRENSFSMKSYFSIYFKEYGLNFFRVLAGIHYSVKNLNPEIDREDKISSITKLEVPILLISGENDYVCPIQATKHWFQKLSAPIKDYIIIKDASHMVNFEQSDKWNSALINLVK